MAASGSLLTREQLPGVKNLFVLNPMNNSFLLGRSERRSGAPTLIGPLVFLILATIFCACPAGATTTTASDGANSLLGFAIIFGLPCLIGAALTYRVYRRALRLDTKGQFLQATITSVSTGERSKTGGILLTLLSIVMIIIDLLSIFDSSNRTPMVGGFDAGDKYEVTLQYTATTPSGGQLSGTVKQNRPDLRTGGIPFEGDPIVILYVNDSLYKVM